MDKFKRKRSNRGKNLANARFLPKMRACFFCGKLDKRLEKSNEIPTKKFAQII